MLRVATLFSRFRNEVHELIPECAIHVGSGSPVWSEVSAADIKRLYGHLSTQYPEADVRYWRARGWGLLIWQPIYLAIIAAHKCQLILPLHEMGQGFSNAGIPSGVLFRCCRFEHAPVDFCVQRMAADLMIGCRTIYRGWSEFGVTRKHADRVVADCVLSALLMVYPHRVETVEALGDLWLTTLGMRDAAGFIRYKNSSGETRLALNKKICCFRYLCHGRSPCDICPRQTMGERLNRLKKIST